jgi:hypothetical protein
VWPCVIPYRLSGAAAPGLRQGGSRFFEKKQRKKLLLVWACGAETSTAQSQKVFLLLFVHKKKSSPSLKQGPA